MSPRHIALGLERTIKPGEFKIFTTMGPRVGAFSLYKQPNHLVGNPNAEGHRHNSESREVEQLRLLDGALLGTEGTHDTSAETP
jgi:hypothetical protein